MKRHRNTGTNQTGKKIQVRVHKNTKPSGPSAKARERRWNRAELMKMLRQAKEIDDYKAGILEMP